MCAITAIRFLGLDPDKRKRHFIGVDAERILAAIGRSRRMLLSFWDALIIETALAGGAERLLTEDLQHGQIIDGLQIENPFSA